MKEVTFTLSLINIFLFAWSAIGVFPKTKSHNMALYRLLVANSISCYLLTIYSIYLSSLTTHGYILLSAVYVICALIFLWSYRTIKSHTFNLVFTEETPECLITTGPYKFSRNPFYLCYIIFFISTALIINFIPLILLSITLSLIYYAAIKDEERRFVNSGFSEEYKDYMGKTARFFLFF